MTTIPPLFTPTQRKFLFVGIVAGLVSGCANSIPPSTKDGSDYRQTHAIQVTSERVSIAIKLPDQGLDLSPSDQRRFKAFLQDFVRRGRTLVTVESTLSNVAKDILMNNGLRANEINVVTNSTLQAPNAIISFSANKVVVPECGDWSSHTTFTPDNKPHSNFGCATQRSIGSIISDPGDLMQAQPATGAGAVERSDAMIFNHQSGAVKTRLLDGG